MAVRMENEMKSIILTTATIHSVNCHHNMNQKFRTSLNAIQIYPEILQKHLTKDLIFFNDIVYFHDTVLDMKISVERAK